MEDINSLQQQFKGILDTSGADPETKKSAFHAFTGISDHDGFVNAVRALNMPSESKAALYRLKEPHFGKDLSAQLVTKSNVATTPIPVAAEPKNDNSILTNNALNFAKETIGSIPNALVNLGRISDVLPHGQAPTFGSLVDKPAIPFHPESSVSNQAKELSEPVPGSGLSGMPGTILGSVASYAIPGAKAASLASKAGMAAKYIPAVVGAVSGAQTGVRSGSPAAGVKDAIVSSVVGSIAPHVDKLIKKFLPAGNLDGIRKGISDAVSGSVLGSVGRLLSGSDQSLGTAARDAATSVIMGRLPKTPEAEATPWSKATGEKKVQESTGEAKSSAEVFTSRTPAVSTREIESRKAGTPKTDPIPLNPTYQFEKPEISKSASEAAPVLAKEEAPLSRARIAREQELNDNPNPVYGKPKDEYVPPKSSRSSADVLAERAPDVASNSVADLRRRKANGEDISSELKDKVSAIKGIRNSIPAKVETTKPPPSYKDPAVQKLRDTLAGKKPVELEPAKVEPEPTKVEPEPTKPVEEPAPAEKPVPKSGKRSGTTPKTAEPPKAPEKKPEAPVETPKSAKKSGATPKPPAKSAEEEKLVEAPVTPPAAAKRPIKRDGTPPVQPPLAGKKTDAPPTVKGKGSATAPPPEKPVAAPEVVNQPEVQVPKKNKAKAPEVVEEPQPASAQHELIPGKNNDVSWNDNGSISSYKLDKGQRAFKVGNDVYFAKKHGSDTVVENQYETELGRIPHSGDLHADTLSMISSKTNPDAAKVVPVAPEAVKATTPAVELEVAATPAKPVEEPAPVVEKAKAEPKKPAYGDLGKAILARAKAQNKNLKYSDEDVALAEANLMRDLKKSGRNVNTAVNSDLTGHVEWLTAVTRETVKDAQREAVKGAKAKLEPEVTAKGNKKAPEPDQEPEPEPTKKGNPKKSDANPKFHSKASVKTPFGTYTVEVNTKGKAILHDTDGDATSSTVAYTGDAAADIKKLLLKEMPEHAHEAKDIKVHE